MPTELCERLSEAAANNILPSVIAYNRIDGPGSSLDLRLFQQALWRLPRIPEDLLKDRSMEWSRNMPRTVGITINTGTKVEAHPFERNKIGIQSVEYGTEVVGIAGEIVPTKENWLVKIVDIFDLSGVMFVLHNLRTGTHSAGLGGSATATTGVCVLANELAGRPFGNTQLAAMASCMEHDLGVSMTGTQEQANVVYGGIVDYLWCPWGIPGRPETGFGTSIRTELLSSEYYGECEKRMAIFHTGKMRDSTDVNAIWSKALLTVPGYTLHGKKLEIAYEFREGIRLQHWDKVAKSINDYRKIRTNLGSAYLAGAHEIVGHSEALGCAAFPLGAGGGGGVLVFGSDPDSLALFREEVKGVYREIPLTIKSSGHDLANLPLKGE